MALMSCSPNDDEIQPLQRVKASNPLYDNTWQLTQSHVNQTATLEDSSIWNFEEGRVFVNNEMYRLTHLGSYISIGFEVPRRFNLEFVNNDSLVISEKNKFYQYRKL